MSNLPFDPKDLPEDLRKKLEEVVNKAAAQRMQERNPEFVAKYGDITDPENPFTWKPSTRKDKGLSLGDRLKYAELDIEITMEGLAKHISQTYDQIGDLQNVVGSLALVLMRSGQFPELDELLSSLTANTNQREGADPFNGGPIPPDHILQTVDGPIRADQVPGYKEVPGWVPSPDWLDANCACPVHTAKRDADRNKRPGDDLPGLYL